MKDIQTKSPKAGTINRTQGKPWRDPDLGYENVDATATPEQLKAALQIAVATKAIAHATQEYLIGRLLEAAKGGDEDACIALEDIAEAEQSVGNE